MKKVLPVAVLAALAGVNGAQAVHVNPDGLGQVLVFPYYTTEGAQNTLVQLVNTTDEYKAVKIRILESMNSQEVLDFNLYMSPQDHWSAQITVSGEGAAIQSSDTSCTVPNKISDGEPESFRTTLFDGSGDNPEDSVSDVGRTREGYIEVIEMGIVVDTSGVVTDAIEHEDGVPGDCALLQNRWLSTNDNGTGEWLDDDEDVMSAPTGGLYGYGVLIDVEGATNASYDAVALDDWSELVQHSAPGDLFPNIANPDPFTYNIFDASQPDTLVQGGADNGADVISALFMASAIANDYVLVPEIGAGTDWVVTFPTKRFYVNGASAVDPFTSVWSSSTSSACEEFSIAYYDREEGVPVNPPGDIDFSPLPPDPEDPTFSFCYEANVLTFNGTKEGFEDTADVLGALAAGRSGSSFNFEDGFVSGWAKISFDGELSTDTDTFEGLPVTGFAVQRYINENSTDTGANNRYAGTVKHKVERSISVDD